MHDLAGLAGAPIGRIAWRVPAALILAAEVPADPARALQLGQAGRQRVLDHYTSGHLCGRVERAYERLLATPLVLPDAARRHLRSTGNRSSKRSSSLLCGFVASRLRDRTENLVPSRWS